MHIIQILPALNEGGVERYVIDLNSALTRLGHPSTVISAGGKLVQEIEAGGGRHITFDACSKNPLTVPKRVAELQTLIKDLSPDILHAHSRVPAWLCRFANRTLRIPFVTTVHGFNHVSGYSSVMTRGDAVVCVSNAVKKYIQQHYRTPEEKITVISCGVNPNTFDPSRIDPAEIARFKTEFNLHGKQVITTVGRISSTKDFETFIRSIAICKKHHPEICGLIVGTTKPNHRHYRKKLDALVHKMQLDDAIIFAGPQTCLPEIYTLSEVIVSTSRKPETFGLTLIEALAMNTPAIATRHGGPLDIIQEGENGHFFTPGNEAGLASQIKATLSTPPGDLRSEITQRFSTDQMAEKLVKIYRHLQNPA